MFSLTCQYALRALIHLALHEGAGPVLARDIAEIESIPKQFLSKILHDLRIKGLVASRRGPGGGFFLARPASEITVAEVAEFVDGGEDLTKRCILGLDECNDQQPCALHDAWAVFRGRYAETIASLNLRDMASILAMKRELHPPDQASKS
jgi:Rrf2 family protein